jgi:eukaryotic-like serine/threonine-protein kinase
MSSTPRPFPRKLDPTSAGVPVASREESWTRKTSASVLPPLGPPLGSASTLPHPGPQGAFDRTSGLPPSEPLLKPLEERYAEGDVIAGKYQLARIIGRGGMGSVWLAHNLALDIDVAVKLIRRDRTAPEAAGRLLQEARAAARLKHPSIVRVFDFGETELGDPFIAMELLQGEPLGAVLRRRGRLPPVVAVQTLLPVAAALVSAHSKGIVHRDLKPDNVFLVSDESGELVPKVVDFGIAKLISPDIDRQVTMAGAVLGSPDYMSPEQARGAENVDDATDVWTFTVLLYEALTGQRPFDGPNYNALIAAILTQAPCTIMRLGVHEPELWTILERGLAKSTAHRYASMRELGAALASWVVARGVDEDVAGNPIAKQWLGGASRRLISVYPEAPSMPPQPLSVLSTPPPSAARSVPPGLAESPLGALRQRSDPQIVLPPWEPLPRISPHPGVIIVVGLLMVLLAAASLGRLLMRREFGGARPPVSPMEDSGAAEAGLPIGSAATSAYVAASPTSPTSPTVSVPKAPKRIGKAAPLTPRAARL